MAGDAAIMAQLEAGAGGKTQVVKEFPEGFPDVLTARGEPQVYTRENSANFEYIGMPVGGIGCGQLYLGGDGALWYWDLFNTMQRRPDGLPWWTPLDRIPGEEAYAKPVRRSGAGRKVDAVAQGFAVAVDSADGRRILRLDREGSAAIEFRGRYPIGHVTYRDPELPLTIDLEAFSPFVPLDLESSSYPATILQFTLSNTSDRTVEGELAGWLENAVCHESRGRREGLLRNRVLTGPGLTLLESSAAATEHPEKTWEKDEGPLGEQRDFGSMVLALVGPGEGAVVRPQVVETDLPGGAFDSPPGESATAPFGGERLVGSLGRRFRLAPGQKTKVTYLLSWHFPNLWLPEHGRKESFRFYGTRFESAADVSRVIASKLDDLVRRTRRWCETWYDSTLPYWFLDRTFLNASILASSTCFRLRDGRFYGHEGAYHGPGTCTHVWGYAHAPGRLFPELEINLRERTDLRPRSQGGAMRDDGVIEFRGGVVDSGLAVDGQSGIILRSLLAHQMSADHGFLRRNYPRIKKAMQALTTARDGDHDGILTGAQHNTLDADWFGKITWLSLHYTAALHAMAVMATETGDQEYAALCRRTADRGRRFIEDHLFNGEYFFHEADPGKPDSPGVYTGCEYSQLLGQSWAYPLGLGEILDPAMARKALESLWRYNFTTDVGPFRKAHPAGRWYAMPGEGGLIACTWPRGGSDVLRRGNQRFAGYLNECQNGYEYACSSLMMWHGMPYHSLAHTWFLHHRRYDGATRNPWCEIEWGTHYSRSMASYGVFTAICGFEYHGPRRHLAFSPRITPEAFRAPFTSARGWGTFSQVRQGRSQDESLTVRAGALDLRTLGFDVPDGAEVSRVAVAVAGTKVASTFEQQGRRVRIALGQEATLEPGRDLSVQLGWDGGVSLVNNTASARQLRAAMHET
jgi:uncharacterized protein (DUF608 family)